MKTTKSPYQRMIFVCMNASHEGEQRPVCASASSEAVLKTLKEEIKKRGLQGKVRALKSGCLDLCEKGPNLIVYPEGTLHTGVSSQNIPQLIEDYLK